MSENPPWHPFDGLGERGRPSPSPHTAEERSADLAREVQEQLTVALDLSGLGRYAIYLREPRVDSDARYSEIIGQDAQALMTAEGLEGLFDLVHRDDIDRIKAVFEAAMLDGARFQAEYRIWQQTPDGPAARRVVTRGRVEMDDEGPVRMIGVVEDITEKWLEEQARIGMQKREALGSLASGIAHDFNNVISAILSNAYVADAELDAGASPSASIREIKQGARRAGDLVQQIVAFSREQEPVQESVDLGQVAHEAASLVRPTLAPTTALNVDVETPLPSLVGDSTQMHQVLVNLITNASHATSDRGTIEVGVDAVAVTTSSADGVTPGAYVRLRVHDDGSGIPDAVLPRIFDPFFTTKPVGEGTGLGLAAVQTIVHNHRGVISVRSPAGAGTTFTIHLPLMHPGEADAVVRPVDADGPAGAEFDGPLRVLFVDDEQALTRLADRALPLLGCRVTVANDPERAARRFARDPDAFDVLITDLSMPNLTGLQLIEQAREHRPDVVAVLTSGFLTVETQAMAARLRVDAIIPKPCSMEDLVTAARDALQARST
jgi:signal transduction histidine kinase/ActR/RegA family two-component response regulator